MEVSKVMRGKTKSQLKYASISDTVEEVASRLRIENVGAVPIQDAEGDIVGMISERDIVRAIADFGPRALAMNCTEVASHDLDTCKPEDSMARVARRMTDRRVRHLLVKSSDDIVGIVSIGDVVKHRLEDLELETGVLRDIAVARH